MNLANGKFYRSTRIYNLLDQLLTIFTVKTDLIVLINHSDITSLETTNRLLDYTSKVLETYLLWQYLRTWDIISFTCRTKHDKQCSGWLATRLIRRVDLCSWYRTIRFSIVWRMRLNLSGVSQQPYASGCTNMTTMGKQPRCQRYLIWKASGTICIACATQTLPIYSVT